MTPKPAPWRRLLTATTFSAICLCLACDTDSVDRRSGLPRTALLGELTPEQGVALCDWTNSALGGYGRVMACPSGTRATDRDQAYCLCGLVTCPMLTVASIEDCSLAQGADLCKYYEVPECAALRVCASAEQQ